MTHREAVEVTLSSASLDGRYEALVTLVRALADHCDSENEISARMGAVYLSAIRQLARAIDEIQKSEAPKGKTTLSRLRSANLPPDRAISVD